VLRAVVATHLLLAVVQAVLAGQFLSGADHTVVLHELLGLLAMASGLAQALACIKRAPLGFLIFSIVIVLAEALQIGTGYGRFLAVHIPLGVIICAGLATQLTWLIR
jgi:hypothetical protein